MSAIESGIATERPRSAAVWGAAALAAMAGFAAILLAMGRDAICPCGSVELWHGAANDGGTSQHISDWYSLSHVIHGFLFYGAAHLIGRWRRASVGFGLALVVAILVEGGWELVENSPVIIDRYRETTASDSYAGDSVLNSLADIAFMVLGFLAARVAPVWLIVAAAIAMELVALWVIRDNLTLNVLMILWPIDAVREWQGAVR
ncbi:DUF2585 domain-containing protein [Chelatococcus sambhunathii]|uniref:UPF0314 protein IHQ68_17840 n=1 Tax=Chelatococcus sambhunathii TaxID=363953 RepID=A0ABU1DKD0_9HYPH|nr:DUF2585 domain-containing protein [Chelatococcus sambhunathii]MDR4308485.1 DUF2585 domain-containing protein [Chelatococcus sambhunathii]